MCIAWASGGEGKRILARKVFSGKRRSAEDHATREEAPRRRKNIEQRERGAARRAPPGGFAGEAGSQPIGDADRRRRIERASAAIARKRVRADAFGEEGGELPGVAQPEVHALARDRMQRLRGVADIHLAAFHARRAYAQAEWLHASRAHAARLPRRAP